METISIISFAAASLAFLTTQIGVLKHDYAEFRDYEERITYYRDQLEDCRDHVKRWNRIWGQEFDAESKLYEELLGKDEYRRVKSKYISLQKQCEKCFGLMRVECKLAEPESYERSGKRSICDWFSLSKSARSEKGLRRRDINILSRLSFCLWRSKELHQQLSTATTMAENLSNTTKSFFRSRGYAADKLEITRSHVDLCKNMIHLSRFASALYGVFSREKESFEFALNLRWPETDHAPHYLDLAHRPKLDFSITFRARCPQSKVFRTERHFRIRQSSRSESLVGNNINSVKARKFANLERDMNVSFEGRSYFISIVSVPNRQHKCIRNMMSGTPLAQTYNLKVDERKINCAISLVAVTLWFILFLRTSWFEHLHCTRLYCASLNEDEPDRLDQGLTRRKAYIYRPWELQQSDEHTTLIFESNVRDDKLLRLGTFYGELILGEEVRLEMRNDTPRFMTDTYPSPLDTKIFSYLIEDEVGSEMADAVEYCLDARNRRQLKRGHSVRLDSMERNILSPIWKFYRKIIDPVPSLK